jgi:hypothetical protein
MKMQSKIERILESLESRKEILNKSFAELYELNKGSLLLILNEYSRRMILWGYQIQKMKEIEKNRWIHFRPIELILEEEKFSYLRHKTHEFDNFFDYEELRIILKKNKLSFDFSNFEQYLKWELLKSDIFKEELFFNLPDPYTPMIFKFFKFGGSGLKKGKGGSYFECYIPYGFIFPFDENNKDINTEIPLDDEYLHEANDLYFSNRKLFYKKYLNVDK